MISCLSLKLKQVLAEEIGPVQELLDQLEDIPTCPIGQPIGFEIAKRRSKRQPSEYQQFIGQCMKTKGIKSFGEAPKAMKECAAQWRKKNGTR